MVVGGLAFAAALGGAVSESHPTANRASDVILAAALAALTTVAASMARTWTWIVVAAVAAACGSGSWQLVGIAGEVVAVGAAWRDPAGRRIAGAVVGAASTQVLLRLGAGPFIASTALLAGVTVSVVMASALRATQAHTRAVVRRATYAVSAIVGLVVLAAAFSLVRARSATSDAEAHVRAGLEAARQGDTATAGTQLQAAAASFADAHDAAGAWWARPAELLPVAGQQVASIRRLTNAGDIAATAAAKATTEADVNALHMRHGQLDLAKIAATEQPLAEVLRALRDVDDAVARSRSPWLLAPLADRVEAVAREVNDARDDADLAAEVVKVAPELLGGDGTRRYFVLFANPAESRDLGGITGGWGELLIDNGKLDLVQTGQASELNDDTSHPFADPTQLPDRYRSLEPERFWQNVTGSPDFPTVAAAVRELWPSYGGQPLDGVLYVDPYALSALLRLTGPIESPDLPKRLTAKNALAFLTRDQYLEFGVKEERYDMLSNAAQLVFDRLTSIDLPGPRQVADTLGPAASAGRLLLHSFHPDEQQLFHRLGLDGELPPVDGDFLAVTASNRGANKIDTYVTRSVEYDATVDPATGVISSLVRVTVTNDAPADGAPDYLIGFTKGQPRGTYSPVLTVMTGLDLESVTVDGAAAPVGPHEEYGRHSYSVPVVLASGTTHVMEVRLHGVLALDRGYHLTVVPRSNVSTDQLTVRVAAADGWHVTNRTNLDAADAPTRTEDLSTTRTYAVQFGRS